MTFQSLSEKTALKKGKSKYCCSKHIDEAFDDFLVEYETFPDMEKCENEKCDYCNEKSLYKLV